MCWDEAAGVQDCKLCDIISREKKKKPKHAERRELETREAEREGACFFVLDALAQDSPSLSLLCWE